MYELEKMERYLRVNLLGPGPCLIKKRIYQAAVSQRFRNTALGSIYTRPYMCTRLMLLLHVVIPSLTHNSLDPIQPHNKTT